MVGLLVLRYSDVLGRRQGPSLICFRHRRYEQVRLLLVMRKRVHGYSLGWDVPDWLHSVAGALVHVLSCDVGKVVVVRGGVVVDVVHVQVDMVVDASFSEVRAGAAGLLSLV